jgi:hypothetical protein
METPTILFLGESPPVGTDPSFLPFDCASGTRLARVLGLRGGKRAVVELLRPRNLFSEARGVRGAPAWDPHEAEANAAKVWAYLPQGSVVVCLRERVLSAVSRFNERCRVLSVPHPSGASTQLNSPPQRRDARRVVLPALVQLGPFVPGDFDLDDEAVRVDLATVLLPEEPARAMVALDPRALIDNVGHGRLPPEQWREWALQARVPKTHRDAAERLRRRQPYLGSDRLYQHWCTSERRACQRALYEAEANVVFERGAIRLTHLDQVDRDILAAKPEDRAEVLQRGLDKHMAALPE